MLIIPWSVLRLHSLWLVNFDQVIMTDKFRKPLLKSHDFLGVVAKQLQKATVRYLISAVNLSLCMYHTESHYGDFSEISHLELLLLFSLTVDIG
jgi:hypothetical protein